MAYVPGFEYDLFLSYASSDNDQGAVEEFAGVLQKNISDNLVNCFSPQEKVRVYFDRERLASQTAVNWEDHLKSAASSSALLVPLLSPNYLSSLYCSRERDWFAAQPHVEQGCPFAVAGWRSIGQNPVPNEFKKAQRHPAGESWLGLMAAEERAGSTREFALKLRDALVKMRASVGAVFLGPAAGRGIATRNRLRDELEKSGFRVAPEADFVFRDAEDVESYLKGALLAIHFPGDGLDLEGLAAMQGSFLSAGKTVLVQPYGSTLSDEEA
jgi:TIR domain